MQDTQKYLNSILEKRLGSVPNHYGNFRKDGNNLTRLPKREQKLQSMPTVFRVKAQTIFKTTGVMPGQFQSKNPLLTSSKAPQLQQLKKADSGQNQRVEYVAISKRIQGKKQELTAPTVDITQYRKTNYIPPDQIQHNRNSNVIQRIQSEKNIQQPMLTYNLDRASQLKANQFKQDDRIGSQSQIRLTRNQFDRLKFSEVSQANTSKRRKIFGQSKEKYLSVNQQ